MERGKQTEVEIENIVWLDVISIFCSKRVDLFDVCNGRKCSGGITELLPPVTYLGIREKKYKEKHTAASLKFSVRKRLCNEALYFFYKWKNGKDCFLLKLKSMNPLNN
jgi:hypothetical protein